MEGREGKLAATTDRPPRAVGFGTAMPPRSTGVDHEPGKATRSDAMTTRRRGPDGRDDERLDAKAFLPPAYFVAAVLFFVLALLATFL